MKKIAQKYNRSIAQVCIKWNLQLGNLPLPKSVTKERIIENADIFDFEVDSADMEKIAELTGLEIRQARNPDEAPF